MTPRFDYRTLGRLKSGQMNKTETAYSVYLEGLRQAGEILFWKFNALSLRLADNTFYKPDFLVIPKNHVAEIHEVKGFMMDDANVKIKVAADQFPFVFKIIRKGKGGMWNIEEV